MRTARAPGKTPATPRSWTSAPPPSLPRPPSRCATPRSSARRRRVPRCTPPAPAARSAQRLAALAAPHQRGRSAADRRAARPRPDAHGRAAPRRDPRRRSPARLDRARGARRAGPALRRGGHQPAGAAGLRPGGAGRVRRARRRRRVRLGGGARRARRRGGELPGRRHAVVHRSGSRVQGGGGRDAAARRRRRRPRGVDRPGPRAASPSRPDRRRAATCAGPGTTSRPATPPWAWAPRSGRRRSACWRPSGGSACSCGPGRGSRSCAPAPSWWTSGSAPAPGQIVDVNSYALAAAARDAGADAYRSGILPAEKRRLDRGAGEPDAAQRPDPDRRHVRQRRQRPGAGDAGRARRDAVLPGHHASRARGRASAGSAATTSR